MPEDKKVKEEELDLEEDKKTKPVDDEEIEIVDEEILDEEDEDQGYKAKVKPELSKDEVRALNLRSNIDDKRPRFRRQEWFRYKRLGTSWRRARGISSKTRRNYKYRPNMPSKGYRGPKSVRGRHPSGFEDVLVHNTKDLDNLDQKKQAIRIAHTVGTRKRADIVKKAEGLNIRILNRGQ